jgi:hypothetical protein
MTTKRKVVITDEEELFIRSNCKCDFCEDMHKSYDKWTTYVAETNLQKGLINVV